MDPIKDPGISVVYFPPLADYTPSLMPTASTVRMCRSSFSEGGPSAQCPTLFTLHFH